ncbi:MAG: hypothetical protein P4M11_10390 [Candidatus Pacebacteria bacterium]|nr:hypothetical protein [Candidatus Paceibacterota bacterium]
MLCKPHIKIAEKYAAAIVLTAGHVVPDEDGDCAYAEINGRRFDVLPIFHYRYNMFTTPEDPVSKNKLSCSTDFSACLLLSDNCIDRKHINSLPLSFAPPAVKSEIDCVSYFPDTFFSDIAAPWADNKTLIAIKPKLQALRRLLCQSHGIVLGLNERVIAATCSTIAGYSGCPCLQAGKVIGILHGGPACAGHYETKTLVDLIKTTENKEYQLCKNYFKEWKLARMKYKLPGFSKPDKAWSMNEKIIQQHLHMIYGALMEEGYSSGSLTLKYNNFISILAPEIQSLLKIVNSIYNVPDEKVSAFWPQFDNFAQFRAEYFLPLLERKLKFNITLPAQEKKVNKFL